MKREELKVSAVQSKKSKRLEAGRTEGSIILSFRTDPRLKARVVEYADRNGMKVQKVIEFAITSYLDRQEVK